MDNQLDLDLADDYSDDTANYDFGPDLVDVEGLRDECPFCGIDFMLDGAFDIDLSPNGERRVDWRGCCEEAAEEIETYGIESLIGVSWEEMVATVCGGEAPQRVEAGQAVERGRETDLAETDGLAVYKARCEVVRGSAQGNVFATVDEHHRHHDAPQGWKFGVEAHRGDVLVGVAVVGRPVSRMTQKNEPATLEVTRVCVFGDSRLKRDVSSAVYRACAREAAKIGATKLITFTLPEESGASLRAAGFVEDGLTKGGSWNRPSRGRKDKAPTCQKRRWRLELKKGKG